MACERSVAGAPGSPIAASKIGNANASAFQQWMKDVAVLPAEEQVEAVAKKLVELNPGFDGKHEPKIEGGAVIGDRCELPSDGFHAIYSHIVKKRDESRRRACVQHRVSAAPAAGRTQASVQIVLRLLALPSLCPQVAGARP